MMKYRPHRYNTQYPVEVRTPAGQQKAKVLDVNNTGARLEGLSDVQRGNKVQLNILSLRVDAIVQWVAGGRVGLTFRPQITNDQVDILRYRRDGRHDGRRGTIGFGLTEMR